MTINIEIKESDLKDLIIGYLKEKLNYSVDKSKLSIMVKSKQNFKSEWEEAEFKAVYKDIN